MIKLSALIFVLFCLISVPHAVLAQYDTASPGHSCSHEGSNPDPTVGLPLPFSQPPLSPGAPPVACTPFSPPVCHTDPTATWCPTSYVCDNGCAYICATPPAPPPGETTYSISGNVCDDVNGDGIRNPGEDGHQGVTINRTGAGTTTAVTNLYGNYAFTSVPAGTYNVSISIPAGFHISPTTAPTSRSATVPPDNVTTDFCIASNTTLGSFTANAPTTDCLGPPAQPARINLSWTQSTNAERYNIYRDGPNLIRTNEGITNTSFSDSVLSNSSHFYFIEAARVGVPSQRATWAAGWDTAQPGNPANDGWSNLVTAPPCGGTAFSVRCTVSPLSAYTGQNVTWQAIVSGGSGSYTYSWIFSPADGISGATINPFSRSYPNPGIKQAQITVTSGNQTTIDNCNTVSNEVNVSGNASWIQTTGGDVHSDTKIDTPGGP